MQTRSFSKAFRNTIVRLWWIPFLFAAIAGPAVYTIRESERESERFVAFGKVLLTTTKGNVPEETVISEHEAVLESLEVQEASRDIVARQRPEAAVAKISVEATHVKNTGIVAVTCRGADGEIVRELLRLQMQYHVKAMELLKQHPTADSEVLDLANVTPQVLEWPGPSVESSRMLAVQAGLLAFLAGGVAGIVLMLFLSGLWAVFRPAWTQPSLEEIMTATEGLEAGDRAELLGRLVGEKEFVPS